MGSEKKIRHIKIRASEVLFRKLLAICKATDKSKTAVIRDLISKEYSKDKKYEVQYYKDLGEEV